MERAIAAGSLALARCRAEESELHRTFVAGIAGDASAYGFALEKIGVHLRSFLTRRLFGWPDDVDDVVQECLLALHCQRQSFRRDQPLTPWVHAIAQYKMVDLLRSKSLREDRQDPLELAHHHVAASVLEASEAGTDLAGLLGTLPDRQRVPILSVKLRGMSVAETAVLTGMSESAVKIGIHRGVKALAARCRGADALFDDPPVTARDSFAVPRARPSRRSAARGSPGRSRVA